MKHLRSFDPSAVDSSGAAVPANGHEAAERVDLGQAIRTTLAYGWVVVLFVAIGAGAAYAHAQSEGTVYSSTAIVRVFDANNASPGSSSADVRVDPAREVQIEVLYAQSTAVSDEVDRRLGPAGTRLVRKHTIVGSVTSNTIEIDVQSSSGTFARHAAQTYAEVFVDQRRRTLANQYAIQTGQVNRELASVDHDTAVLDVRIASLQPPASVVANGVTVELPESEQLRNIDTQRAALVARSSDLTSQISRLGLASTSRQSDMAVVQPASAPLHPIIPLPKRDAALGGGIGLLAGLGIVGLRVRTRDKVRTSTELARAVPTLAFVAAIPPSRNRRIAFWTNRRRVRRPGRRHFDVVDGRSRLRESYRALRGRVLCFDDERPRRAAAPRGAALLLTGSGDREGKTTIAANLAVALALGGSTVVVVDCDLGNPALHRRFGLENGLGFSSLLTSPTALAQGDSIRAVRASVAGVHVLTAGPALKDPSDLLVRPEAARIISELKRAYRFVVLDGPSAHTTDALSLARVADGVIVVARSGKTRASALEQVDIALQAVSAEVVGAALFGVRYDRMAGRGLLSVATRRAAPPVQATTNGHAPVAGGDVLVL